ncbi:MAG: hypothetical protein CFE34_16545 [Rhodobacteraceae bacterium PARR1]|nr:MAG: hypothetical protein CFE34_16545 [Rhodobacteraceae bacterium PARR1]
MADIAGPSVGTERRSLTFGLVAGEPALIGLLACLAAATFTLPHALGRMVDWGDFLPGVFLCLALMGLGLYARHRVRALRLAVAAVGAGLFMGFSTLLTVLIFSLFPLHNPVIDPWLIAVDARFGYHWASFVIALADYPLLGQALALVYNSAVPMLLAVVILLGIMGRVEALHRMLLVGLVSLIAAVAFWWFFPSIGPSAYQTVPDDVAQSINLVFSAEAGALLRHLVEVGPAVINSDTVVGVVALPSYHTVMMCMVIWYTRQTPAFLLSLVLGLAMLPAILSHGGHNVVDVLGGLAIFALCAFGASRYLPDRTQ